MLSKQAQFVLNYIKAKTVEPTDLEKEAGMREKLVQMLGGSMAAPKSHSGLKALMTLLAGGGLGAAGMANKDALGDIAGDVGGAISSGASSVGDFMSSLFGGGEE